MTKWNDYLEDKEPSFKRKKVYTGGCKKNKINAKRLGNCMFKEDTCIYCNRPRRKINKLDPRTGAVITQYLE
jgi:thioredoxin-related protein